jgi:hypothetical protein
MEMEGEVISVGLYKVGTCDATLMVYDQDGNKGTDNVVVKVTDLGLIIGTVFDEDGYPIEDANVLILASDGETYYTLTGSNGSFRSQVPGGDFKWRITKEGYDPISGSSSVDVLEEKTLDLSDIAMKKRAISETGSIPLIIPVLVFLVLIIGVVIFLLLRKKKVTT